MVARLHPLRDGDPPPRLRCQLHEGPGAQDSPWKLPTDPVDVQLRLEGPHRRHADQGPSQEALHEENLGERISIKEDFKAADIDDCEK